MRWQDGHSPVYKATKSGKRPPFAASCLKPTLCGGLWLGADQHCLRDRCHTASIGTGTPAVT